MKRMGYDGKLVDPEEAIDLETALKMHTINSARVLREEHSRGTLEVGKLADLIVLDRNILKGVDADNVRDVKVDFVYRGGKLVHSREGAAPFMVRSSDRLEQTSA